jgi:hypothetical protein
MQVCAKPTRLILAIFLVVSAVNTPKVAWVCGVGWN